MLITFSTHANEEDDSLPDDAIRMEDIIQIELPSGDKFLSHARLTADRSPCFAALLDNPMTEASNWKFHLVEHADVWTVSLFVEWVNSYDPVWEGSELEGIINTKGYWKHPEYQCKLAQAWLLGDSLQATSFTDSILRVLHLGGYGLELKRHPFLCPNCSIRDINKESKLYRLLMATLGMVVYSDDTKKVDLEAALTRLDVATQAEMLQRMVSSCRDELERDWENRERYLYEQSPNTHLEHLKQTLFRLKEGKP